MPKITVLSEEIINKIAAGEVIERPASVVKELIENSLDARATQIKVEVEDFGKQLIRITDNGEGMDEEDACNSVLRHATSKLHHVEDLFAIQTLGFRGEALASIAAVSQLRLITKPKNQLAGFSLELSGGQLVNKNIVATDPGTIIEVKELFFNTPARKKFLKTDAVELKHIIDVVTKYALINHNINFKLIHNGNELLISPAVADWRSAISSIYGLSLAKELLDVNLVESNLKITGFVAKPYQARNDKSLQALFVNHRWIRNEEIIDAVYDAYHSLLFVNKHPVLILNLDINPQQIDVNVHPNKLEIKFDQKELIYQAVFKAVRETLQNNNLIPVMGLDSNQQLALGNYSFEEPNNRKYPLEFSNQTTLQVKAAAELRNEQSELISISNEELPVNVKLPPLKILGQFLKTFFVAETIDGLVLIDQHVVQERVLYELFLTQLMNKQVKVQKLLKGEVLEFSPVENLILKENLNLFKEFGFDLELFGDKTFLLKTVPAIFGRLQPTELLYEVLGYLMEGKNKLEEVQEEIITRMACRASVKAGDEVTIPQMYQLLTELSNTKLPYTCPHGRAILIKIPFEELERKFKRK